MLQLAFYATSMGNWWRSKLVFCRGELCIALENENQWKLAYTGLHNQNFLIIWNCVIKSSLEIQEEKNSKKT